VDFRTDGFPITADGFFLARSNQFVYTYVNADDIATFALFRFSAFDPNDERFFGQRAALDDPCTGHRQPFVNDGRLASWNGDALSSTQGRKLDDEIKAFTAIHDSNTMTQYGHASEFRAQGDEARLTRFLA
jgi:hypothetical protein